MEPDKRYFRQLKKTLKQKGGKRRRAHLKRELSVDPESARAVEPNDFDFGRSRSADYNRLDEDATRKKP
jgi:hypothetical protein